MTRARIFSPTVSTPGGAARSARALRALRPSPHDVLSDNTYTAHGAADGTRLPIWSCGTGANQRIICPRAGR